jgi:hypothetical protein
MNAPKPEPTFTLADFSSMAGENYSLVGGSGDPLTFAMNVIDDLRRVLYIAGGESTGNGFEEVATNAWARACAALKILEAFKQHGQHAEPKGDEPDGEPNEIRDLASALASKARPQ